MSSHQPLRLGPVVEFMQTRCALDDRAFRVSIDFGDERLEQGCIMPPQFPSGGMESMAAERLKIPAVQQAAKCESRRSRCLILDDIWNGGQQFRHVETQFAVLDD